MKYELKEYHRLVSDKEIIEDLIMVSRRLQKDSISKMEYAVHGRYNTNTVSDRFGVWNDALKKAGLKARKIKTVSTEELFINLKRVWDTLGRQPRWVEMIKPLSKYLPGTYASHFGTWGEALKEFVKSANNGKLPVVPAKRNRPAEALKAVNMKKDRKKISKGMRYDVLRRDNFRCKSCGITPIDNPAVKLHVDHIIPVSTGGETIMHNLQTLCSDCNLGKAAKTNNKRKTGKRQNH